MADCTQTSTLIDGLDARHLLADKGYDTDAIVAKAEAGQMAVVIPPKKNRTQPRTYDKALPHQSARYVNGRAKNPAAFEPPPETAWSYNANFHTDALTACKESA